MPPVNVRPDLLSVHGPTVLHHCLRVPSVTLLETMFREHACPKVLQGVPGRGSPPP
jgi:hypothetical protein